MYIIDNSWVYHLFARRRTSGRRKVPLAPVRVSRGLDAVLLLTVIAIVGVGGGASVLPVLVVGTVLRLAIVRVVSLLVVVLLILVVNLAPGGHPGGSVHGTRATTATSTCQTSVVGDVSVSLTVSLCGGEMRAHTYKVARPS